MSAQSPRFRRRKLQTGILKYPLNTPRLVDTRQMEHRHLALQGSFHYHHDFGSDWLEQTRSVIVYLPPSYGKSPQRYPVLYMHDGNNLFDPATGFMGREWRLDETLERLFAQGLREMIVVGIYNSPERFAEYSWHPHFDRGYQHGASGPAYARFLVEELKPLIDAHYRTISDGYHTGMMGSSLGAMISFYTALAYPGVFRRVGLMSPTVYWAGHKILEDVLHFPRDLRVWIDIGSHEGTDPDTEETIESTLALVQAFERIGYTQPDRLGFFIDWLAPHDEHAWAKRVELPLKYLFS